MYDDLLLMQKENMPMHITINNLSSNVTADSLAAIFSTYGEVSSATIHDNELSAGNGTTALVAMPDATAALRAIEQLNGCCVDGLVLLVKPVEPKAGTAIISYYKRLRGFLSQKEKKVLLFI